LSGIYGIVRLDGRPIVEEELETMSRPMAYWGPDGRCAWLDRHAGLGQLIARRTAEDEWERGPVVLADGTVVVAAGRIDNRDELCRELAVAPPERPRMPDSRLIALAYECWGEETPRRLLGDWAFAVWQPRERRLLLARDHYGQTALYYHRTGGSLAFASSLKGLLALPEVPRQLNELRLAQTAVVWADDGFPTLYEGIDRVPPGHMVGFDRAGLRKREFWHPREVTPVRFATDAAYVDAFLDLFAAAVRARLRAAGPVAATLSAGLDSAAVTALAARELGDRPLTAYTARPAYPEVALEFPGMLVDEWPRAQLVAGAWSNVRHVDLDGRAKSPVEAMERSIWIHEQPEHAAANLPWVLALLDDVTAAGNRVLLTGQMGNGGVSWAGDDAPVLRALAARDLRALARAMRHARDLGRGGWRGAVWRGLVQPLRRRVRAEWMRRDPRRQPAWASAPLAPEFVERIALRARVKASGWDPAAARATPLERRLGYFLPGVHPVGAFWHEKGAAYGLDVRDPTMEFASAGQDRLVMRRALADLVPAEVARYRGRGIQAADFAHRLRSDAERVAETLREFNTSALVRAYLDVPRIERSWRAVSEGGSAEAFELSRGLLLGMFLLHVPMCFTPPMDPTPITSPPESTQGPREEEATHAAKAPWHPPTMDEVDYSETEGAGAGAVYDLVVYTGST
jgi:asparagine synthase (glutamine-hydrolysing)